MTLDPRVAVYLNLAYLIVSALLAYGTNYTSLFGEHTAMIVMTSLMIVQGIINTVLHSIPSQDTPAAKNQFFLGPKS